uniref:ESF1 RRM domain-containing protein n=1 Tax=Macaca nemestrina TaxID=9545 RepID=A0A2K6CBL9_MACNE
MLGQKQSLTQWFISAATSGSDGYENSTDSKMLDKDALKEDLESVSKTRSDEESKNEITSVGRASGDDDNGSGDDEDEEEDDENGEDDGESDSSPNLARGKGNIETSSANKDDTADLFPEEASFGHTWRESDKPAPHADDITHQLAVCNMDLDRLKAKDLLALVIFPVKIHSSEFGKERVKEEQLLSVPEDYYYAVVDCDSPETASKIYEDCGGLEFESSCSFTDLRFIPVDTTFDDEPKDADSEGYLTAYKPKYITSAAMGTSMVEITWDETDHERITTLNRKFKKEELLDMDFQDYLASSSKNEEEIEEELQGDDQVNKSQKDDEKQITKYRQLLQVIQEEEKKDKENDMEMEMKWVPGLKESNKLEGKDKLTP